MFWCEAVHPETGQRLEVEASWFPAKRGLRDCFGAPLEPDDEAELVICRVWDSRGNAVAYSAIEGELIASLSHRPGPK